MTDTYDPQSRGPFGFFWGNAPPGSPLSYEALQSRRRIAEALASKRSPFPKNAGEGLTYLGESLNDIASMRALDAQQRAYEAEGNKNAAEAARTLYGTSPGGSAAAAPPPATDATAQGDAQPPLVPATTADAGTPLPPPRPVYDRPRQVAQLQDPAMQRRWAATTLGEADAGASPAEIAALAAEPLNRSVAQGDTSMEQALRTYNPSLPNGGGGYYPGASLQRGEAMLQRPGAFEDFMNRYGTPIMRGASPGDELGFTPTQNASLDVAKRGVDNRRYFAHNNFPGSGELFAQKPGEGAALERARFPRDAIAAAMTPPPTQVASLQTGDTATDAGGGGIVPDQRNPVIPTNIEPAPQQIAQAGPQPPPAPRAAPPPQQYPPTPLPQAAPMGQPRAPLQTPPTAQEKDATIRAMSTTDPNRKALWQGVADKLREQREYADKQNAELYKTQLGQWTTDAAAEQAARRALEMKRQEGQLPRPSGETAPAGIPDPRIGTPQSPQRSGLPQAPPVPEGITPQKWAELQAPKIVADAAAVEKAAPAFTQMLDLLNQARSHPGREYGVGITSGIARHAWGTNAYDFGKLMDQIGGKNFLAAYETLKGAGAVSEVEGQQAKDAQARLSQAQSKEGFAKALEDLETQLRGDLERAQRKMNQPVTAWQRPGTPAYAPDIGQRDVRGGKPVEYVGGDPRRNSSYRELQ